MKVRLPQPIPHFAYQSTFNWMTSFAKLCDSEQFSNQQLKSKYVSMQRRKINSEVDKVIQYGG